MEEPNECADGRVALLARAKINLTLDILGRRPDGYHEIETVMQSVTLADRVILRRTGRGGVAVESNNLSLPRGRDNLASRAAEAFFRAAGIANPGVSVRIDKRIPVAAGLAGGSADAAAVLRGLNLLFGTHMDEPRIREAGLSVGADVPFCLTGGTCLARGIGERLEPAGTLPTCAIVIVKPIESVSTAAAYASFDRLTSVRRPDTRAMLAALAAGDLAAVCTGLGNVFEQSESLPSVARIREQMRRDGALGVCMSGSGPSVYGIYADEARAGVSAARLRKSSGAVFICRPAAAGWDIDRETGWEG